MSRAFKVVITAIIFATLVWNCSEQPNDKEFTGDFGYENFQYRNTEIKNLSPYAIFGDSSFVLMTEEEWEGKHSLKIPNYNDSLKYSRYELQLKTGLVKLYSKNGELAKEFILPPEVITRFLSVDPRAEKYHGWSPYNYVLGNPILNIDPNGDTVLISHKGKNYMYDGGKLFLNGAEYTGKVKGFLKRTVNALGTISGSAEGASMLAELSSSSNIFTIKHGSSQFKPSSSQKAYANQLATDPAQARSYIGFTKAGVDLTGGSGGTIYWDPSGSALPTTSGVRTAAFSDLAYEMFHGLDANRGLLDERMHLDPRVDRSEWQAVYRENMMRSQLKMPLRTHYISRQTPSGTVLSGAGPSLLTSDNKPILPYWYTK